MLKRFLVAIVVSLSVSAFAHEHDPGEKLGAVKFPISCSRTTQATFERGIALLHSFWYEESEKQFVALTKSDPKCAMAHWGVAMSIFHQLWERPDDAVLQRGAKELKQAAALKPKSQRERDYIAALTTFYSDDQKSDYMARANAYSAAMKKLYESYPEDHEAGAFYALSLLASEPVNDTTFANRKLAVPILNKLFQENPEHPGLAHYIIHTCDKPQLASLGLEAARRYAKIAPSSPHALHMPSHIFARLGLWDEDIASNRASIEATRRSMAQHMGGAGHQFHAMDFLLYALLQSGDDEGARAVLADANHTVHQLGAHDGGYRAMYAQAQFPALYSMETKDWKSAAALVPPEGAGPLTEAITYWARTIGKARSGDAAGAKQDLQQFEALVTKVRNSNDAYEAESMDVPTLELRGWVAFAEKSTADAIKFLREAADAQDARGKEEVEIPAREMLADMLLELNHPAEALAEYERALSTDPNRFNGIYGAGHAAELAGEREKSQRYYAQLLKNTKDGARSQRQEIAKAKMLVAQK